jgi:hypothetical protein
MRAAGPVKQNRLARGNAKNPAPAAVMRLVHRHHTAESTKEFAECKKNPAVAVMDLTRAAGHCDANSLSGIAQGV